MWQKLKDDWNYHPEQRKGLWVLVLFVALAFSYLWITDQFIAPAPTSYRELPDSTDKGFVARTFYFDPNRITSGQLDSLGIAHALAKRWVSYRNAGGQFKSAPDLLRLWGMDSATYLRIAPYALFPTTNHENPVRPELAPFDPNTLDSVSWLEMGMKPYQVKSIRRFIRRGGRFAKPEDLRKMWVLDSVVVKQLLPYVVLDSLPAEPKELLVRININRADSADLVQIKGLGGVYARRIIQHRRKLRGFVNLSQLLEVYGVDSARYEAWIPFMECNPKEVKKLDINQATVDELGRHPYIGYKLAKEWVDFRSHVRPFRNLGELNELGLMDADKMAKIAPYLVAQPN